MPDFSFQPECVERIIARRKCGVPRLVAAAPTGAGKTRIISMLFENELANNGKPVVYTNRRVLREQLTQTLERFGIKAGVRAAGVKPDLLEDAQVSSVDTERRRSLNPFHPWDLHEATLVIVDEIHINKAETAQKILDKHETDGAFILGLTATPVGLGFEYQRTDGSKRRFFDELEILIGNRELRKRGVIVPADVFAPSEIDMAGVDLSPDGDYVQSQARERFADVKHAVVANIHQHMLTLNPTLKPFVVFPPGVPESRWIAGYLTMHGIPTTHIDAETPDTVRLEAFQKHRSGEIKGLSSFGVLAVGWDAPWAVHAVLCRPVAAVDVYLQLVGRILRASPGKDRAILQDHVGAFWKPGLGSPNIDRQWKLEDTNKTISKAEKDSRGDRDPNEKKEPARCPKCTRVLACRPNEGFKCLCGHVFHKYVRMVLQLDGKLKQQLGATTKRKPPKDDTFFFRSALWACRKKDLSVSQAYQIANRMKQQKTGDKFAHVKRGECKILIPQRDEPRWLWPVTRAYPWLNKQKT